jgi:hypothetical protein
VASTAPLFPGLPDPWGLLALVMLLLVPGCTVVRAPWTAVPFLSLAFWTCTWWWISTEGGGREAFLRASLFVFGFLLFLRLLRARPSIPAWPDALVVALAVVHLVPYFVWPVAPRSDASFHALVTRLMVWHDSVPLSYEPLLPLPRFGFVKAGLSALAADLGLLAGLPPHRAALAVTLAAEGLVPIALYGALKRFWSPRTASFAACLADRLIPLSLAFGPWDAGPSLLALGLAVSAAGLLLRSAGRSPAVAAGLFMGAAFVAQPFVTAGVLAFALVALRPWRHSARDERNVRLGFAGLVLVAAALPAIVRSPVAVSAREWSSLIEWPAALSAGVPTAAVLGVGVVAWSVERLAARSGARAARAGLCVLAVAAVLIGGWEWRVRGLEVALSGEDAAAMAWIEAHTSPLAAVCNGPEAAGAWVPAVAGRAVTRAAVPFFLNDELETAPDRVCEATYASALSASRPSRK